jgi:NDP-sugar pyrophosphorylase family protein
MGENHRVEPGAHIGQYTEIEGCCHVAVAEVGDSIVMDDRTIDFDRKTVTSMIGKGSKIMNANPFCPRMRVGVGDSMTIYVQKQISIGYLEISLFSTSCL